MVRVFWMSIEFLIIRFVLRLVRGSVIIRVFGLMSSLMVFWRVCVILRRRCLLVVEVVVLLMAAVLRVIVGMVLFVFLRLII